VLCVPPDRSRELHRERRTVGALSSQRVARFFRGERATRCLFTTRGAPTDMKVIIERRYEVTLDDESVNLENYTLVEHAGDAVNSAIKYGTWNTVQKIDDLVISVEPLADLDPVVVDSAEIHNRITAMVDSIAGPGWTGLGDRPTDKSLGATPSGWWVAFTWNGGRHHITNRVEKVVE